LYLKKKILKYFYQFVLGFAALRSRSLTVSFHPQNRFQDVALQRCPQIAAPNIHLPPAFQNCLQIVQFRANIHLLVCRSVQLPRVLAVLSKVLQSKEPQDFQILLLIFKMFFVVGNIYLRGKCHCTINLLFDSAVD
jgi:hypothetical protein